MNQLLNVDVQMTSLDIAEVTGKRHADVMRDIRKEIKAIGEIDERIFTLVDYVDKKGEKRPCYEFGKDGAMQLALKYDAKTRYNVLQYIKKLELAKGTPSYMIDDPVKRAEVWIVEQKEKQELEAEKKMLEQQVSEYEPLITYVDEILKSTDLLVTTQIAEDYGMTAQKFNKLLHEYGIQYKMNGQWLLYGKYKGLGYTKSETTPYRRNDGTEGVSLLTKWTQKGRLFLYEFLKSKRILPTMEQTKL